jgi:hypothetical protein
MCGINTGGILCQTRRRCDAAMLNDVNISLKHVSPLLVITSMTAVSVVYTGVADTGGAAVHAPSEL